MAVNLEVAAKLGKPLICASFPDATRKVRSDLLGRTVGKQRA
jgi:hypothetical protein